MGNSIAHCGIVILAAGQSRRMGQPKQLMQYNGASLLHQVVVQALASGVGPVIVVLGAHADQIGPETDRPGVETVINPEWETGMASSIRVGLECLVNGHPESDGVLFLVCDQPFLDAGLIQRLIQLQKQAGAPAVCCSYKGALGTPAVFHHSLFAELLQLKGDTGARKLLERLRHDVVPLNFEEGAFDIDTPEDYQQLLQEKKGL